MNSVNALSVLGDLMDIFLMRDLNQYEMLKMIKSDTQVEKVNALSIYILHEARQYRRTKMYSSLTFPYDSRFLSYSNFSEYYCSVCADSQFFKR